MMQVHKREQTRLAAGALTLFAATLAACGPAAPPPGRSDRAHERRPAVTSHVRVTSDRVPDVSSLDAWRRSFLRDGMTDEEKALAVWRSVVMFRHQDDPPREYRQSLLDVHDPIRNFNVYGYGQCCCATAFVEALARAAGLDARGRVLAGHVVSEVGWGGAWHMLDGAFVNYFRADPASPIAAVDTILSAVDGFYQLHPALRGDLDALQAMRRDGTWKTAGPAFLAACPFYDEAGLFADGIHGWHSTMRGYDASSYAAIEQDFALGYEVNVQLRRGEKLVRRFGNKGLHVNALDGLACRTAEVKTGEAELRYTPAWGDLAPGRVGNGTHRWDAPLDDPAFLDSALVADNVLAGASPGPSLRADDARRPATLILRMPSSYVYLSGALTIAPVIGRRGSIDIDLSDDQGHHFRPLAHIDATPAKPIVLDLSPLVARRYDYRLRFVLRGEGTGLDALRIEHDIQHSQRALPALGEGDNVIHAGAGPEEGTITLEGTTDPAEQHNITHAAYDPLVENLALPALYLDHGEGSITFPIETPGALKRVRFGGFYRARAPADGWRFLVSFDDGASFIEAASVTGPTAGDSRYVTVENPHRGTRRALVRYAAHASLVAMLFDFRIDADYDEPHGGFRPFRITYEWDEDGHPRRDEHIVQQPDDTYVIRCAKRPVMRAITVEPAD